MPTVPLRRRLILVAAAGVLPVALAAGVGLLALVREQYRAAEAKSLEVVRLAASAMEAEVQRTTATLRGMASSPWIDRDDIRQFHVLMTRALRDMPAWESIALARPDGTVIAQTGTEPGRVLPPVYDRVSFERVVRERVPTVGNLRRGENAEWGVPVRMPVLRDGNLVYVLSAVLRPDAFLDVMRTQKLPEGWIMSVFDTAYARIVRSSDHARTIGGAPSPSLQQLISGQPREGHGITESIEKIEIYTAYVRMPFSGWTTAIGIPTASVQAPAMRAFAIYGGGTVLSLLAALGFAALAAKGITRPLLELRRAAERAGRGEPLEYLPTPIDELNDLARSLAAAADARGRLERERTATLRELLQTRDNLEQQVADLERLHRLSHDLLRIDGLPAQLHAVLEAFCELHGAPQGLISLASEDGRILRLAAARGFSDEARVRLAAVESGAGACGTALLEERRVVVVDTETDPAFEPFRALARAEKFRRVHSTPIRAAAGRVLGVLSVHGPEPGEPTTRQERLADLIAHLVSIFIDRAQAQAAAAESGRRLSVALDSSIVPFSILAPVRDGSGTIVDFVWEHANRAAAAAIRRQPGELVGQRVAAVVPELWRVPGVFDACVAVAQRGEPRQFEAGTPDGMPEHWAHVVATPFDGKVAIWAAEVTERKRHERALQSADRRKDEFLAILAHELRNPLAPIQQAAMIASAPAATEAQQRWSQEVIVRQVKQMSLLLDDLLDISRITRGKLELRKARIDLAEVVGAAVETARPHFEAKQQRLVTTLPPQPVTLDADALRIAQVLTNLLTNAARYTNTGGLITLAARVEGGVVAIDVIDSGIGIERDQLESIFQMFARGRAGSMHGGGLGVGLALARGVAQLHGGTLTATSAGAGQGSCFTLRLPLAAGAAAGADAATAGVQHVAGPPLRIVVVDDNRDAANTLASLLRLHGHEVLVAFDGAAAIELCAAARPRIAILDIGMPQVSGYEAAQRIRAQAGDDCPVLVALTGWGQAKDRASSAGAGFDYHLTKPVDVRALFGVLRAAGRTGEVARRA